jgi:long-chain acyl-CoA synthetase
MRPLAHPAAATLPAYFRDAVTRRPDWVLFRRPSGETVSYAAACRWVASTAARLEELGVRPGSFVVTYLDDTVQTTVLDLACCLAGVTPVPLSPSFSLDYLRRLCRQLDTRWVVTAGPGAAERVAGAGLAATCFGGAADLEVHPLPRDPVVPSAVALARVEDAAGRVAADDLFMIQPTSGSTGTPKLVRRTHRSFARYAVFVGRELADQEHPRFLAVAALTHAFGLHMLTTAVALGAELDVPSAIDTAAPLDEVRALDPTVLPMTPRVLRSMWRQALAAGRPGTGRGVFGPSARFVLSAGGRGDPQLLGALAAAGVEVLEWYGSSEGSIVALTPRGGWREGWAGRVVDDTRVRVAPDGELLVRSPGLLLGYHGDQAASRACRTRDGFYRTGDLGELSGDGWLRVVGRKRDLFNTPEGSNIYPERIETMLEALPTVDQAMLVGDGRPFLAAFIVVDHRALAAAGVAPSPDAHGVIDELAAPRLYARFERDLAALNRRLEPIEQVRRFALLARRLPPTLYGIAGQGKVRRSRPAFLETFAGPVGQLYEDGHPAEPGPDPELTATPTRTAR